MATNTLTEVAPDVHKLDLLLAPDASLRQVIAEANEAAELRSVNEAMTSMNDIFIQTVNNSNNPTLQQ